VSSRQEIGSSSEETVQTSSSFEKVIALSSEAAVQLSSYFYNLFPSSLAVSKHNAR